MIKKIHVENFQAHSNLEIDFDEHVSCIVGSSDRGKSAVFRAIRWLATNRPQGDEFVKDGTDGARVRIQIDGNVIARKRGKTNSYRMGKETFKAFGSGVPEPIVEFLNLGEINFQGQHDPPYLFCQTPGEIAKELNRIVDLQVIDDAVGKISKELREVSAELKVLEKRRAEATEAVEQRAWVVEAWGRWKELEADQRALESLGAGLKKLFETLQEMDVAKEEVERAGEILVDAEQLGTCCEQWCRLKIQRDQLENLLAELHDAQEASEIEIPDLGGLEKLGKQEEKLARKISHLQGLVEEAQESREEIVEFDRQLCRWEKKLAEISICPTCKRPL